MSEACETAPIGRHEHAGCGGRIAFLHGPACSLYSRCRECGEVARLRPEAWASEEGRPFELGGSRDEPSNLVSTRMPGAGEVKRDILWDWKRLPGRPRKNYTGDWVRLGISRANYYRRKNAGTL